ncbi:MAG: glycosyltransferase family 39 protein [Planctomyces sp.]|nr:glycosyltransferase family 39 protein [Planctomyces sp.]
MSLRSERTLNSTADCQPSLPARVALIAILAAALGLRLWVLSIDPQGEPKEDSAQYHRLGANLAFEGIYSTKSEEPFEPSARRMPGYPAFLSLVYKLHGAADPTAGKFAGVLLGVLACWLTWRLARDVAGSDRVALLATALTALSPPLILFSAKISLEALFTPLLVGATWTAVRWQTTGRLGWVLTTGLLWGGLSLIKPESLLLPAAAGLAVIVLSPSKMRAVMHSLAAGAVVAACVGPWVARNYYVCGRASLQFGNRDEVHGEGGQYLRNYRLVAENGMAFWPERYTWMYGKDWEQAEARWQAAIAGPVKDPSQSHVQFWLTHPGLLAKYTGVRFLGLMTPTSWSGTFGLDRDFDELKGGAGKALLVVKAGLLGADVLSMLAGLAALVWSLRWTRRELWVVSATVLYFLAIYSLLHGIPRYRAPLLPLMYMLTSAMTFAALDRIRSRRATVQIDQPANAAVA